MRTLFTDQWECTCARVVRADFLTQNSGESTRAAVVGLRLRSGSAYYYLQPRTLRLLERVHRPRGCADATVTFCMVDLGVLSSPLAQSAFRMDTKFDLPAAISKLRYTTTKLRPRDGPSLQWRNEFADLLAMNGLTDYITLSPPSRQASHATYADANEAEAAFAAHMRAYQHWNALLYHLLQGCMDLNGTHYRLDTDYISQHFAAGDLRDRPK